MKIYRARGSRLCSRIMLTHYLFFLVMILACIFKLIVAFIPCLYMLMLFSSLGQYFALQHISLITLTQKNQEQIAERNKYIKAMRCVFFVAFALGFVPI